MSRLFDINPRGDYFSDAHHDFRRSVRQFVEREIAPYANDWDEAGTFPRELYRKAADIGLIGVGYPEEYGGTPADLFYTIVYAEELARAGCGGVQASLGSHGIGLPPVVAHGSDALKRRVVPQVLSGEKIAALAITEPGGGSDVAALKTTAQATNTSPLNAPSRARPAAATWWHRGSGARRASSGCSARCAVTRRVPWSRCRCGAARGPRWWPT